MEQWQQLLLQFGLEIDQQVATTQQVEPGEGWVHHQVLRREDDHLADLVVHPIAVLVLHEIPPQALLADVGGDVGGIDAGARLVDGVMVEVGGEDLQVEACRGREFLQHFAEDDGERVGLLARGAAGRPRPQHGALGVGGQQRGEDLGAQLLPDLGVAEEAGDADQQLLEQEVGFLRVVAQVAHEVADVGELVQPHAALDAAVERALLVVREVMAGACAQQHQHLRQPALVGVRRLGGERCLECRQVLQVAEDAPR